MNRTDNKKGGIVSNEFGGRYSIIEEKENTVTEEDTNGWDKTLVGRTVFTCESTGDNQSYHTADIEGIGRFCSFSLIINPLQWAHEETMENLRNVLNNLLITEWERQENLKKRYRFFKDLELAREP